MICPFYTWFCAHHRSLGTLSHQGYYNIISSIPVLHFFPHNLLYNQKLVPLKSHMTLAHAPRVSLFESQGLHQTPMTSGHHSPCSTVSIRWNSFLLDSMASVPPSPGSLPQLPTSSNCILCWPPSAFVWILLLPSVSFTSWTFGHMSQFSIRP